MSIKGNEKAKTQRTIDDIVSGNFDERHIDHLFMSLRAHSDSYFVFKEISHFVAHNDIRNSGITTESLEAFYLSFKYFSEYVSPKNSLDISSHFPIYIIKLMKYQIDKCEESELREKFNVTKNRLKSRIDNLFKIDKKNKIACLKKNLSESNYKALQYILGFIGSHAAYTQEDIISELIAVLSLNKLTFKESEIKSQGDRIMLCILSLIHNSEYDFEGHKKGCCNISCEKTEILHGVTYVDEKGEPVEVNQSYGNLQINGYVAVINNENEVTVCYPVIRTNLGVEQWCNESLFSIVKSKGGAHLRKVDFDGAIGIGENFLLVSTNT